MSKFAYFYAKNAMLIANCISNAIGVAVIIFISRGMGEIISPGSAPYGFRLTRAFLPLTVILATTIILIYERPIRRYLNRLRDGERLPADETRIARQRVLNEPFLLIGMNCAIWLSGAFIFAGFFWASGANTMMIQEVFFQNLYTGLISVTISFFVLEFVLQRRVVPLIFPDGGLSRIDGALRIRIRTRLIALLFAINIIPLLALLGDIAKFVPLGADVHQPMARLKSILLFEIFLFIFTGIWVVFLVSSNLTKPLKEIIHALRHIKRGDFSQRVRVTSNDEIGYTGDVINEMSIGLIERDQMRQSLYLAKEVQQNLLPSENLKMKGFDIAGRSLYCDETGGDYYDFIPLGNGENEKIGIAIGDVSGHGISAALLMATVRSALRLRTALPGSAAQIITDVNRQLVQDVEDSGQFMTLFFLVLDDESKTIHWVRAGHDPAIIYNPESNSFVQLEGRGLALGIEGESKYEDYERAGFQQNQIIFLSTDGLWEVQDASGEMLGKKPILNTIREHASASSTEIRDAILKRVSEFSKGARIEDDITLVIVRFRT